MSLAANTDPNIDSFYCPDRVAGNRYLRTSPEFPMKRLLAAGSGAIYELGRVFRHAEQGARHNPEFTMLEWYRPGFDHHQLMDEVEALLQAVGASGQQQTAPRYRYVDIVRKYLDINPLTASDAELNDLVNARGWFAAELGRSACLDLILSLGVMPEIKPGELVFIYDFPACQAALAVIDPEDCEVAQRFEVFLGPVELANGYHELCEPVELAARFEAENKSRNAAGKELLPVDQLLIAATTHGIESCAGVAMGVDRLLMALANEESLQAVLNFPWEQA